MNPRYPTGAARHNRKRPDVTRHRRHPGGRTCGHQLALILLCPPVLLVYAWRTHRLTRVGAR